MNALKLSLATSSSVSRFRRHDTAPAACPVAHLGPGAFHRAHEAVYGDDLLAIGEDGWGIVAVASRSDGVIDTLERQDGLFTVATQSSPDGFDELQVCRSIGAWARRNELAATIASSEIRLVTLTVTEAAYRRPTGQRAGDNPLIESVVAGLTDRWRRGRPPLSFLSCDNLVANGARLRSAVMAETVRCDAPAGLRRWLDDHVSFASSVVDRIVAAPGPSERARVANSLGVHDELAVVTEPFRLWVFEDRFVAGRPPWERVGAIAVDEVGAYEALKLRVLNAAHSMAAFLGLLAGQHLVSEAMNDDAINAAVTAFQEREALVTLPPLVGIDPAGFASTARQRFRNPALPYTLAQVASSSSSKLPERTLPVAADHLAAGRTPYYCALTIAAWIRLVELGTTGAARFDDPRDTDLSSTCRGQPTRQFVIDVVTTLDGTDAQAVAEDSRFVGLVAELLDTLRAGGLRTLIPGPSDA